MDDEEWIIREAAIKNLEDQELLSKIAVEDEFENVREAANTAALFS